MYFGDHVPSHFHANYNEFSAQISIENLRIINGYLPPKISINYQWASDHQDELRRNWQSLSENGDGTFIKIEPLK